MIVHNHSFSISEKIEEGMGRRGAAAWGAYVDGILLNAVWVRRPLTDQTTTVTIYRCYS